MSGSDMSYEEFKQLSEDAWKENFSYPKKSDWMMK